MKTEVRVCPYLKLQQDATIRFGFPDAANSCYKAEPPQPVAIGHQGGVCLHDQHKDCEVYLAADLWKGPLPQGLRAAIPVVIIKDKKIRKWSLVITGAGIVLIIIEAVFLYIERFHW